MMVTREINESSVAIKRHCRNLLAKANISIPIIMPDVAVNSLRLAKLYA
jgi:hypothetical protein